MHHQARSGKNPKTNPQRCSHGSGLALTHLICHFLDEFVGFVLVQRFLKEFVNQDRPDFPRDLFGYLITLERIA